MMSCTIWQVIEKIDPLNASQTASQWNYLIVGYILTGGDQVPIDIGGSSWHLKIWTSLDTGGSSVE